MIYEVQVSKQADADLRGIYEYIAFELLSPENASGQLERLEKSISNLDYMPKRYKLWMQILYCAVCGVCRRTKCLI